MEYENQKKGHGLLALILGILGILVALFTGLLFGLFGIIPALILAVLAIFLGIKTKRNTGHGGKGGLITGIIAIIFSLLSILLVMAIGSGFKSPEFQEMSPTLAAHSNQSWKGLIGIFLSLDESEQEKVQKEIADYGEKNGISEEVTTEAAQ